MAVVVASMVVILITAVVVLLAVFAMHVIARSPRARMRLRRWVLATATSAYSVRREMAQRVRLLGRYGRRRLAPHASRAHKAKRVSVAALFTNSSVRPEPRGDITNPRGTAR
jgi:hypothetical protein